MPTPTTHVANGCNQQVFVKVDTTEDDLPSRIKGLKIEFKESNPKPEAGYTALSPGAVVPFNPKVGIGNANWLHRSIVYITVYYIEHGEPKFICSNYQRPSNHSAIIASDKTMRATKMGELWIDTNGINHQPPGYTPTTHVANASDQLMFVRVEENANNSSAGYTTINPGSVVPFKVGSGHGPHFDQSTVYITVCYMKNDRYEFICNNLSRPSNNSVIIAPNYSIRNTKNSEIWIDTSGINYQPPGYTPTTHVANGCDKKIFVRVDMNNVEKPLSGYTAISTGVVLPFKVGSGHAPHFDQSTVYITAYYIKNDEPEFICDGYPRPSNHSVIVAKDYTIRPTKMSQLWIDISGINHQP